LPDVTLNKVIAPTKIWNKPITLPAHKSDVIRIFALQKLGGIYLDLDVFT
jgi:hypothetical protein